MKLSHLTLDIYSAGAPHEWINEWRPLLQRVEWNMCFWDGIAVIVKQLPALCRMNHVLEMSASVLTLEEVQDTNSNTSINLCSDNDVPSVSRSK